MKIKYAKGAFRYAFRDLCKAYGSFLGIFTLAMLLLLSQTNEGMIGGMIFGANICAFVCGASGTRSHLRLCIQLGVSRRTAFVTMLLSAVLATALAAFGEELISALLICVSGGKVGVMDLYQIIYLGGLNNALSFAQHILSSLFNFSLMFSAFLFGVVITLTYWRLEKRGKLILSIGVPALFLLLPSTLLKRGFLYRTMLAFVHFFESSVWGGMGFMLILSSLAGYASWLLLRKANIRESAH